MSNEIEGHIVDPDTLKPGDQFQFIDHYESDIFTVKEGHKGYIMRDSISIVNQNDFDSVRRGENRTFRLVKLAEVEPVVGSIWKLKSRAYHSYYTYMREVLFVYDGDDFLVSLNHSTKLTFNYNSDFELVWSPEGKSK